MNEPPNADDHVPEDHVPDESLFIWACGFELTIGAVGLLVAWIIGFDARAYLPRIDKVDWTAIAIDAGVGTLAALPMMLVIMLLMKISHPAIDAIKGLSEAPTMRALLSLSYAELFAISLCAGIGEELAFRGCLLPWLVAIEDPSASFINPFDVGESFRGADVSLLAVSVILSSIAFGMLHPITKLYVVVASLMGVYFAALLILTDSLLVPIVAHGVYDALQFCLAKREVDGEEAES